MPVNIYNLFIYKIFEGIKPISTEKSITIILNYLEVTDIYFSEN